MKNEQRPKLAGIEIPITAITGKYNFPNNNFLNGKTILSMWIPDNTSGDVVAPSGNACVSNTAIVVANITIRKDSDAVVLDVPLVYFQESWDGGDRRVRPLFIEGFNPGTTFINMPDTSPLTLGQSFIIMVEYVDPC